MTQAIETVDLKSIDVDCFNDAVRPCIEVFRKNGYEEFGEWLKDKKSCRDYTDEVCFKVVLWIMIQNGYSSPGEIRHIDFKVGKKQLMGVYNKLKYKNNMRYMIQQVCLLIDTYNLDGKIVHINNHIAAFTKEKQDAFTSWVLTSDVQKEWTISRYFEFIMWIMMTKKYEAVYEIMAKDFTVNGARIDPFNKQRFEFKHGVMIKYVCNELCVDIGEGEFPLSGVQICQNKQKALEHVPEYLGTEQDHRVAHDVKILLTSIPEIVDQLCVDVLSCALEVPDDRLKFLGVVYAIYIKKTLEVIYVGSTQNYNHRQLSHKTHCKNERRDKDLYTFVRDNGYDFDDDLSFMILATCPAGYELEKILEAEVYDHLWPKATQQFRSLQNGQRPLSRNVAIDSKGYIYKNTNLITNTCIYVGKSLKVHSRICQHKNDAYKTSSDDYNKPFYVAAREINNEGWPEELQFEVIEAVPMWLQMSREHHYIQHLNTINNGYNRVSVICELDQFVCQHCNKICKRKEHLDMHIKVCKQNPIRDPYKHVCQFCDKKFTQPHARTKHETTFCKKNPNRLSPQFKCHLCHKSFTTKQVLDRHLKEVAPPSVVTPSSQT